MSLIKEVIGKNDKPIIVSNEEKYESKCERVLKVITKAIYSIIANNVDIKVFSYTISVWEQKINNGDLVINLKLKLKENTDKGVTLSFIVNRNEKTGIINLNIVDVYDSGCKILFSTSSKFPLIKGEKYIITIIESAQNKILNGDDK